MTPPLQAMTCALVFAFAGAASASAPDPRKSVEIDRYLGRWYEIARTPNKLQKDCIDATADYVQQNGRILVVQTCQDPDQQESAKVFRARAQILDPETNAKLKLTFMGFWSQEYWVIDRAQDYSWAIVGDPSGNYLWVLSRDPGLSGAELEAILARAEALGYDLARLEYARSEQG